MHYNSAIKFKKIDNQAEAIAISMLFLEKLKLNTNINIQKAMLFGSYANGTNHEYSDVDLAIWSTDFVGVGFLDNKIIVPTMYQNSAFTNIECHTFTSQNPNPFEEEILKTGIVINLNQL
jgi:uncharacterized protein